MLGLGEHRLSIYLNDHLAGATAGLELARSREQPVDELRPGARSASGRHRRRLGPPAGGRPLWPAVAVVHARPDPRPHIIRGGRAADLHPGARM
jgi:hypothetical protein